MIVKFEQSDASILHEAFGENPMLSILEAQAGLLDTDWTALQNNQTYREIIALKAVLAKGIELAKAIDKTYKNNL